MITMKTCPKCSTPNGETARFCSQCGYSLASDALAPKTNPISVNSGDESDGEGSVDIAFVLDVTASMESEIQGIRRAITRFVDEFSDYSLSARVALIAFRDRLYDEEHEVIQFEQGPFTNNAGAFREAISHLKAEGGKDLPESSLDAVLEATRLPFRPKAQKVLVLVTDAPPHVPDKEAQSVIQVRDAVMATGISQFYLVVRTNDLSALRQYMALQGSCSGFAWDIGEGEEFSREREDTFVRTLLRIGETISDVTVTRMASSHN